MSAVTAKEELVMTQPQWDQISGPLLDTVPHVY